MVTFKGFGRHLYMYIECSKWCSRTNCNNKSDDQNPWCRTWTSEHYSELSFLKQGRPRTYLLRLSVCLSCLKPKKNWWNQKILVINLVGRKQNLTMMQTMHGRGPRSGPEKLSSAPRSTSSIRLFCPQRQHTSADETIAWLWFVMTFHRPFFYLSYVTVYICFTAIFLPPLVTAGTLSRQKILEEKMMQISRSCLLAICVLLLHVTSSFSYNLNSKIMNIATKRLAVAAIVPVGLTGLPD